MGAKIKQFAFDGIFTLLAIGWLLSVCYFLVPKDRLMDSKDFFLRGYCAFFIITAGFIFLRGYCQLTNQKVKTGRRRRDSIENMAQKTSSYCDL